MTTWANANVFARDEDGKELIRMKTAKKAVAHYLRDYISIIIRKDFEVTPDDIYIVWFCKTLQNWKALLSTDLIDTGIYFEVTYNGDKKELYLDHYTKIMNRVYEEEPNAAG